MTEELAQPTTKPINPSVLGKPRGYSNGVECTGTRTLFIAGQIAWDSTQTLVAGGFAEQFAQALKNVVSVVQAAGGTAAHVGQLTVFVTDKAQYLADLKGVGARYREVMGSHYPAMALVEVKSLLDPNALVEIQGIAVLP